MYWRTTKIIRANASKETLKYEISDLNDEIHEHQMEINALNRKVKSLENKKQKLIERRIEMKSRYDNL